MRRSVFVVALVVCLLQGAIAIRARQQPAHQNWGGEYLLWYSAFGLPGDSVSGDVTFNPNWVFRIMNPPEDTLLNPTITVATGLYGSAVPSSIYGATITEDPANHAYVWTMPAGTVSPVPGQLIQADLSASVGRTNALGYTLTRAADGGQRVDAGATVTRRFTLTLALTDSAREFEGGFEVPANQSLLPVVA